MTETTFTALSRTELENLIFDITKAAIKTVLKDAAPVKDTAPAGPSEAALLTKKQAAELLACSASTIDNHARAGRLTRRYIGKSVRFDRKEVLALASVKV